MVSRTLARSESGTNYHDVVVFQLHVMVGFLFHGNRLVLSGCRCKGKGDAGGESEESFQDKAPSEGATEDLTIRSGSFLV